MCNHMIIAYVTSKELKAVRQRLRLTQQKLADVLQVSRVTVARWEIGERGVSGPVALLLQRLLQEQHRKPPKAAAKTGRRRRT
jgi:DNA-binding transcriptional regulator YiaG